jgi:phosphoenolpyruvate-protein kinase (PTS system EI component)
MGRRQAGDDPHPDAGGDKLIVISPPQASNPFLGVRGIRLAGSWKSSLFSFARRRAACHGALRIMLPMVTARRLEAARAPA